MEFLSPRMTLGIPEMDRSHQLLLSRLAAFGTADDYQLANQYMLLVADLERDFREEETYMDALSPEARRTHCEQHARLLAGLHHVTPQVMMGDAVAVRNVVSLLPQWLAFHIVTMDRALAESLSEIASEIGGSAS